MGLGVNLMIGVELGYRLGAIIGVIKVRIKAIFKYNNNKCAYSVRYIIYNL